MDTFCKHILSTGRFSGDTVKTTKNERLVHAFDRNAVVHVALAGSKRRHEWPSLTGLG